MGPPSWAPSYRLKQILTAVPPDSDTAGASNLQYLNQQLWVRRQQSYHIAAYAHAEAVLQDISSQQ
eukprot:scaffold293115_cov15-Prasinocladus_malaysianus.AAC.1